MGRHAQFHVQVLARRLSKFPLKQHLSASFWTQVCRQVLSWSLVLNHIFKASTPWDPSTKLPPAVNPERVTLTHSWRTSQTQDKSLTLLSLADMVQLFSWNIYFPGAGRQKRATAAIDHISTFCSKQPMHTQKIIVLLQEVHEESLREITNHPWVKDNFQVSNTVPPSRYFTLLLFAKEFAPGRLLTTKQESRPRFLAHQFA
jgi:hypothetical protein